jgi:hypothetical protein
MKNSIKSIISVAILILGPVFSFAQPTYDNPSPIPAPDFGPGGAIGCGPAGAPIGSGYWILIALALAYGIYSYWQFKRAEKPV